MKKIYMIGNTHFDPVWLWKWEEAMASIHSTFRSALDRMKENKDFIYSFATPPVFEWIKQVDPDLFKEIKVRIKEGRWELCEGWWLQPDCFSASGESYARQSLYGQRYLMENFGIYADTVFNIDSFGHNSATPQILQKSHIDYYCMCRPEKWHFDIFSPYFTWQGKDGSKVKAFRAGQYSEIYNKDMRQNVEMAEENLRNADCDELMVYGVTNHGGAPTKKAIADIHALGEEKPYEIKFSTVSGYFQEHGEPNVAVVGEMLTGNFGPYTNNHEIKRRNRLAEYAVLNAEKSALIAKRLLNRPYPKEKLQDCWKDVLFNQFHDILGGASIKEAYFDAYNGLGRAILSAEEITQFALQAVSRKIKTPGKNPDNPWNIVAWNLNDREYEGYIEAEVQWLHEFPDYKEGILLADEQGNEYPCQVILERSVIDGFRSRFVFKAKIPATGYKSFKVIQTHEKTALVQREEWKDIQTDAFDVTFDENTGYIRKLYCKNINRTFENILLPECLQDDGDTWCFNVKGYGAKIDKFRLKSVQVTENGLYRTTVKVKYTFEESWLTLYYTFYNQENYFDVRYVVNWNEKHTVLKLASYTGASDAIVSSPFSMERRGDTACDQPMGEWLTMQGKDYGVSFIAESAFSYTKQADKVSLSLLRSCIYGDLRLCALNEKADYPIMEQGISEGRLRIAVYGGDSVERGVAKESVAFNNPPLVICEANHDGIYAPTDSFMQTVGKSVTVSAWKQAENGDGEIVRLYEYAGKPQNVRLERFGKVYDFSMNAYEIKTLKFDGENVTEVLITED